MIYYDCKSGMNIDKAQRAAAAAADAAAKDKMRLKILEYGISLLK